MELFGALGARLFRSFAPDYTRQSDPLQLARNEPKQGRCIELQGLEHQTLADGLGFEPVRPIFASGPTDMHNVFLAKPQGYQWQLMPYCPYCRRQRLAMLVADPLGMRLYLGSQLGA